MILLRAGFLAAVIGLVAAPAMATTLEFDTAPTGAFTSFTDDGFLVTLTSGKAVIAANGSPGNDIETAVGNGALISITSATPGGTFDATNFQYAIVGIFGGGSVNSAGLLNGSEVLHGSAGYGGSSFYSYTTENLVPDNESNPSYVVDTLNITIDGEGSALTAISDINLTALSTPAAVPEPPALSVLGTGILALAGVMVLRHKKV